MINLEEFKKEILYQEPTNDFINAVIDMITFDGIINLDYQDLNKTRNSGNSLTFGIGKGRGIEGVKNAASDAIPKDAVLKYVFRKASSMIIQVKASNSYSLVDISGAVELIFQGCLPDLDVIFGLFCDSSAIDECEILVIANGWLNPKEIKSIRSFPKLINGDQD
jgi:cell division protein FtsZ